jgi:hypothetical protein
METVTDRDGRKLTLRAASPSLTMDILEAAGVDRKGRPVVHLVQNDRWMGYASLACHVSDIDGVPLPMPQNIDEIKATVTRLGDAGLTAVAQAFDGGVAVVVNEETAKN